MDYTGHAVYFCIERSLSHPTVLHCIEFNTDCELHFTTQLKYDSEDGEEDAKMNNMAQTMQLRGVVQKNAVTSAGQTPLYKCIITLPLKIATE